MASNTVTVAKWTAQNTSPLSTLSGIAKTYGTTVQDLVKLNPQYSSLASNPNLIQPGWTLNVPGQSGSGTGGSSSNMPAGSNITTSGVNPGAQTGTGPNGQPIFMNNAGQWVDASGNPVSGGSTSGTGSGTSGTGGGAGTGTGTTGVTTTRTPITLGNGQTVYADNQGNFFDAAMGGNPVSNSTISSATAGSTGGTGGDVSASFLGNDPISKEISLLQSEMTSMKGLMETGLQLSKDQIQQNINNLIQDTGISEQDATNAHNLALQQINQAFAQIGGMSTQTAAQTVKVTNAYQAEMASYQNTMAKYNAQITQATTAGNTQLAQLTNQEQQNYLGFVTDSMTKMFDLQQKQQTQAQDLVYKMATSGALGELSSDELYQLSVQSGLPYNDVLAMSQSSTLTEQKKELSTNIAAEQAQIDYYKAQTAATGQTTSQAAKDAELQRIESDFASNMDANKNVPLSVYQQERQNSTLSPTDFDKRFGYMLSAADKTTLESQTVKSSGSAAKPISQATLNKLAAATPSIDNTTANWIQGEEAAGTSYADILAEMSNNMDPALAKQKLDTFNQVMEVNIAAPANQ